MNARRIATTLLVLGALLALPSQALAEPAPAWKLTANSQPTNFAPGEELDGLGPAYFPIAHNIGAAPTSGPVTITVTFPAGLTPVDAGVAFTVNSNPSPPPKCDPVVSQVVTCEALAPIYPGNWFGVNVGVDVAPLASGTLSPEASVSGGGAGEANVITPTAIDEEPAPFSILDLQAPLTDEDGSPATQAGSHPTRLTVDFGLPVEKVDKSTMTATEHPGRIVTELPRGLIINPAATPVRCTEAQLTSLTGCPRASQVGTVSVLTRTLVITPYTSALYNMVPPPGEPASLGFDALGVGVYLHLTGEVRSDGDYGLSGVSDDIPALGKYPVLGVQAQLWGDPTSPVHDEIRACAKQNVESCPVDPAELSDTAFLTMPTECSGEPLLTRVKAKSWENPEVTEEASYESADLGGTPSEVEGCNQPPFEPTIEADPTTNLADSPSGLAFKLHQPQDFDVDGLSTAALKDALVTLPEGMVANPSQADGLAACSPAQVGLTTPVGQRAARFDKDPVSCPDAAKLGKVEVSTPLLDDPIPGVGGLGAVYLAEPFQNPFGSLIALYLVIEDPQTDTVAKLAGEVIPNPVTGQITTKFEENPQLPLEDVELELFEGPRAPLRTPPNCGTHTTTSELTPWSAPEGANAHPSDSFQITAMPGGGTCPSSVASAPNQPTFAAGTQSPVAATYSPFVMKITREDASQELARIEATLPSGLSGKLAGIGLCSEAQLAQAQARSNPNQGILERQSPSCPASSEVGTVDVAAGAGITPLHVEGKAYLAGPYKGAPLSLVIITPAIAGPFDLGAVAVRTALYVDPKTAQIHAVSDPLPTILEGIPLDVRSIYLRMGRPEFTLNPTSCDPMAIEATTTSIFNQPAALQSPFQVGGCSSLPFKPKLSLALKGGTKRGAHPKLIATLSAKPGEANIAATSVQLPRSAFLDQSHIGTVCTRVQFAADQCPKRSIYGKASATTPLLDYELSGNVYLRSSDNELPDLLIDLRGPAHQPLRIELAGRTDAVRGALRNSFDLVPDAPVSKFRLELFGGRRGLVINSRSLCARKYKAIVQMDGQNGKVHDFNPVVGNDCPKKQRKRKGKR